MSTTPPQKPANAPASGTAPLNPALKQGHDGSYGPDQQGRDPMETISVRKPEGEGWSIAWAVVVIAGVLIALVLLFW